MVNKLPIPCNVTNCNLSTFSTHDECVLHCEKGDYSSDFVNNQILPTFCNALINYIIDYLKQTHNSGIPPGLFLTWHEFKEKLESGEHKNNFDSIKNEIITFDEIFFPGRKDRDYFDFLTVLNKLGKVSFIRCKFAANSLEMNEPKVFYDECEFHQWWNLTQSSVLSERGSTLYDSCIFHIDVSTNSNEAITSPLFSDCTFKKKLVLQNTTFNAPIFSNSIDQTSHINELLISQCAINNKFILNNDIKIKLVEINDTEFKEKFEFKNNKVSNFKLLNVNFKKIFDAHKSQFQCFLAFKGIYDDFVSFPGFTSSI